MLHALKRLSQLNSQNFYLKPWSQIPLRMPYERFFDHLRNGEKSFVRRSQGYLWPRLNPFPLCPPPNLISYKCFLWDILYSYYAYLPTFENKKSESKIRWREAPEQGEGVGGGCPPSHDRDFLHFQHVKVAFPLHFCQSKFTFITMPGVDLTLS